METQLKTQPKIFISYRRHFDAPGFALKLYSDLVARFGAENVFKDLHDIEPGDDFVEEISKQVDDCRVFLAVIGPSWVSILNRKRAEKDRDFVLLELSNALLRRHRDKKSILIIPVLVNGAEMPDESELPENLKELTNLNQYSLPEEYWEPGVDRLTKKLEDVLGITSKIKPNISSADLAALEQLQQSTSKSRPLNFAYGVFGGGIGGLLVGATVGAIYSRQYADIPWWRFSVAGLVGLVVGATGGAFISYGVTKAAKFLKGVGYASVIGGVLLGAIGGVPTLVLGGLIFFGAAQAAASDPVLNAMVGGNLLHPFLIAAAVCGSSFFIGLGLLNPTRHKLVLNVFINALVTVGMLMLAIGALAANLERIGKMLNGSSASSPQILMFGPLFGVLAGLQVGLAVWAYNRLTRSADLNA